MAQPMEIDSDTNINKRKCILLLGGSFSPIHNGHIAILVKIKNYLETNHNYHVISGYLVISSDRYVARKLNVCGMKWDIRKNLCDIAVSNYKWIHSSHVPQACASYYGEIITRKTEYKKFFNQENGNELDDDKQELESLMQIDCMGADKLSDNPEMMQWLYCNHKFKYCCIGRQGHTDELSKKYDEYIRNGKLKKDSFYFIAENGTHKDVSSTMIRECLFKLKSLNEEKDDMDIVKRTMEDGVDNDVLQYMMQNIQILFFTEDEIMQCLLKKGKVVPINKVLK